MDIEIMFWVALSVGTTAWVVTRLMQSRFDRQQETDCLHRRIDDVERQLHQRIDEVNSRVPRA